MTGTGTITATVVAVLVASTAPAADTDHEFAAPTPSHQDSTDTAGYGLHFQVGGFGRIAGNDAAKAKDDYLLTGDLAWVSWRRSSASWGLGVHFAFDEAGHRLGLKGLWRKPLRISKWSYLQIATGVYLTGTDDAFDLKLPGVLLEAELGLDRAFALVVAAEALPYRDRMVGYIESGYEWTPIREDGTSLAFFAGGKAGQGGAVALSVIGVIAGIAVLASFASSGPMFGS